MKLMDVVLLVCRALSLNVDIIATPNGAMLTDEKGSPVGVMRLVNGRRLEMVYRSGKGVVKQAIRLPKFVTRPMHAGDKLRAVAAVVVEEAAMA